VTDTERLLAILAREPVAWGLTERIVSLGLPDAYVGAGAITQTVWNHLHGFPLDAHRKDIDVVYFDPEGRFDEEAVAASLRPHAGGVPLDVVNQARVHAWYPAHFGIEIPPFTSTEAAIATWPTPASAIGVRRGAVCAPLGLADLLGCVARPNRVLVSEAAYTAKVERWKRSWPKLRVIRW